MTTTETMRLLVLGCSQRKRPIPCDLSALERYDGPAFRVLRKFMQAGESDVHLCVLSARFGLIQAGTMIPLYDERMTAPRAQDLQPEVLAALLPTLQNNRIESVFFGLGRDYWPALDGWRSLISPRTSIVIAQGNSGYRAALLREWLGNQVPPSTSLRPKAKGVQLGGRIWNPHKNEMLALVRRRISECEAVGDLDPLRFHSWCVRVDGRAIAPKWLVAQVTGLPLSAFHTEQACRALLNWGLEVERQSLLEAATEKKSN